MPISAPLRAGPFFSGGGGASPLVPYRFPVSIDGRPYMLDTAMTEAWGHETVPLLRPQADDSEEPGESSLNPEGVVRRGWRGWHKGAGQTHRDRDGSLRTRFLSSVGVDPWERYELTLLNGIDQKHTSSNTNLKMVVAGNRLFLVDGAAVTYTEDITVDSPTWTGCTNEPGGTILDIASNGEYVWITDGANSFWADASAAPPAFNLAGWTGTQDADVLGFVKGRLMSGHDGDGTLATYDASGVATAVTVAATIPVSGGWTWVGFAGGPTTAVIYAAGYAGDKSLIFRIGIKDDGSGLDPAIVAGELPDGEIVRSIGSYLGQVLIGTDEGVRFAVPDQAGNLEIGALLRTGSPCRCFEGQGPWVWFGWDVFTESALPPQSPYADLSWTGLGRLSLEEFSAADKLAPAYATDLMTNTASCVTSSVVTFQDRRVWCSEGTSRGVYAEGSAPGSGGYLVSSATDFGFTGNKTAIGVDVGYVNPTGCEIAVQVEADDSDSLSTIGEITDEGRGTTTFGAGFLVAERFRVTVELTPSAGAGPTIRSVVLKTLPAVQSSRRISLPLLMGEWLDPDGAPWYFDVNEELNAIEGLWGNRQVVTLREFDRSYQTSVENFRWIPRQVSDPVDGLRAEGTLVVQLKEVIG